MKKLTSLVLLAVVIATGCNCSKKAVASADKKTQDIEFEYTAITRGSSKKATINSKGVTSITERGGKAETTAISVEDWNWLVSFYEDEIAKKNIKLEELNVPSKKHQFDGALAANVSVMVGGEIYRSSTFDHGNPPPEIAALVNKMIVIAGLDKQKNNED